MKINWKIVGVSHSNAKHKRKFIQNKEAEMTVRDLIKELRKKPMDFMVQVYDATLEEHLGVGSVRETGRKTLVLEA